jgi:hypothetical protein
MEEGAEEGKGGGAKSSNEDYYGVLGVTTDATEAQLKRAYRLKSLKAHPDRAGGSTTAFQLVALAYEVKTRLLSFYTLSLFLSLSCVCPTTINLHIYNTDKYIKKTNK